MPDVPKIGFTPIPGSAAAQAMEGVSRLALDSSNVGRHIKTILVDYGVDRMTASAASEAAMQIAAENPTIVDPTSGHILQQGVDLQNLARSLIGNTVADPRVAANAAALQVEQLSAGVSDDARAKNAVAIAGEQAAKAGASRAVAESKTKDALAAGMSPREAAMAGTAAAVSLSVANNPSSSGLEIFGYLKAMVLGLVTETYLGSETKNIQNSSDWTVANNFIQNTVGDLTINCAHYRATADEDDSIADHSEANYVAGYQMYALHPLTIVGASAGFAGVSSSFAWAKWSSIAPLKEIVFAGDFYVTLVGTTVTEEKREKVRQKVRQSVVTFVNAAKVKFG